MPWHPFTDRERRQPAPLNQAVLTSPGGEPVQVAGYRGESNLVIFFAHEACRDCRSALHNFSERWSDYRFQDAEVLAVLPDAPTEEWARGIRPRLLVDRTGDVRRGYAALLDEDPGDQALLFVLDRYGVPYAAWWGDAPHDPALQDEILEWLAFVELQCPE